MSNDDIIEQIKKTNYTLEIISKQINELKTELKKEFEHIAKMCS